jgi:flagellar assembly protein FliH
MKSTYFLGLGARTRMNQKDKNIIEKKRPIRGDKYFFDQNIFDVQKIEEPEEELPPPPPTFSEQELEDAVNAAYQQGLEKGRLNEQANQNAQIIDLIKIMQTHIQSLMDQEFQREDVFEKEVCVLAQHLFKTVFPDFNQVAAFDQIASLIQKTIADQRGLTKLLITVPDNLLIALRDKSQSVLPSDQFARLQWVGDMHFATGQCSIQWNHGGCHRDPQAIANSVLKQFQLFLKNYTPVNQSLSLEDDSDSRDIQDSINKETEPKMDDQHDVILDDIIKDHT